MDLPLTDDFRSIVLEGRPLIDVRAPVEYVKGAFPESVNLPLLEDEERRLIGIRYKEAGNTEAVELGKKLIDGGPKAERVRKWQAFLRAHPDAYLYCFRGGQRSAISQMWLAESGHIIPRLKGGYKAFRNFLMSESERISSEASTLIIGGRTGSGKTLLLKTLDEAIDLEGIANHRGSSFGRLITPQPAQIDFENTLAYAFIRHEVAGHRHLIIEHESQNIGRVHIPKPVFDHLQQGRLLILETPLPERTQITYDEYVTAALEDYRAIYGEAGEQQWFVDANAGLDRIRRRLGDERHREIKGVFAAAFENQAKHGDTSGHKVWIEQLLHEYYDPMYDYQIKKSTLPIAIRGDAKELLEYIKKLEERS